MVLCFVHRCLNVCALALCVIAALAFYDRDANMLTAALFAAAVLVTAALYVLAERAVLGFRRLRPTFCSIYDPYFWRIERLWKFTEGTYLKIFDGTPFKNLIWRGLGVRVGKRAGIRHVQIRPHHGRRRLHRRGRRDDPLRRDHGRALGARPRLLPDEGRGNPAARAVGGKPREGDVT